MSALCSVVRARFGEYAEEFLTESQRGEVREHLRRCRPCASEAAAFDPTLVFAAAPPEQVSAEEIATILSAVKTGIALENTERRLKRAPKGRRAGAAAAAAAAAVLTLLLPGASRREAKPPAEAAAIPQPQTAGPQDHLPAARPSDSGTFPAKATIYDWSPGAGEGEPRVVWIVDRSLDI